MYYPIDGGSVCEVKDNSFGYTFMCQIPPVGYGKNVMTGELEDIGVYKRSEIPTEQYFERIPLPPNYKEQRKKEQQRQTTDREYVDPALEAYRVKEWKRRLCGFWFMRYNPYTKKSEPIYLTGQNWLYANMWVYQGKKMDYREVDRETFYVAAYIQEDPKGLGLNEVTQRKSGKTGRSGCVAYERTSRMAYHHCGIQSKSDEDGFKMFKKAIIDPWRKLPHFYRPIYDLMKGDDPNELRFFATSRRGSQAEAEDAEEALESFIDYGTSEASFYDGPELHTYISDETGKTRKEVSVKERARVVRQATEIGGEIMGFHWSTTTVEVEENEQENEEFQEFTAQSNPLVRDANGMTTSGYYTLFQPCYKYMYFDRYGFPDEEKGKEYVMNRRKQLEEEGDLRGLSSYKRKVPMTFKEAFSADGAKTLYNPELLNEQLDEISWRNDLTERGELKWYKDSPFYIEVEEGEVGFHLANDRTEPERKTYKLNRLIWEPDPKGRYEKVVGWMPKEQNQVIEKGGQVIPNNDFSIRIGCDPFKYDKTKSKRRSDCAAFAYQMADLLYPSQFDDTFTIRYCYRAESTRLANEDVLKMAWWCGCKVLFERNVDNWKFHFAEWKCSGFLMWMPNELEPGVVTDGSGKNTQMICNYTEQYINKHIKKVYFKSLLKKETGWLGFKVEDTEKFDEPMAAGLTLIAVKGRQYRRPSTDHKNIEDIMPYRKAS